MANIRFSPEEVDGIISSIKNSESDMRGQVSALSSVILDDLCENWDGAASDKYRQEYTDLRDDVMNKFLDMLADLSAQLQSISETMRAADDEIASKISMK